VSHVSLGSPGPRCRARHLCNQLADNAASRPPGHDRRTTRGQSCVWVHNIGPCRVLGAFPRETNGTQGPLSKHGSLTPSKPRVVFGSKYQVEERRA
jgi:hypothetical protein